MKSFIQENLYVKLKKKYKIKKIRFKNLNKEIIGKYDFVINCSNSEKFFKKKYSKKNDRNLIISNLIKKNHTKLIKKMHPFSKQIKIKTNKKKN